MAAVFLSLTGGEALYADMGHFGRRPIRVAWFWIVMPCLMLNYFGQGALVLAGPEGGREPVLPAGARLRCSCRSWSLATCATVIASQAVISGAFSMTSQAVKLGFLPRMPIDYTSETHAGPDLRAVRELAAAAPRRGAGRRLRLVDESRGRLRHRGRDLDGDHDPRRAAGRTAALGLAAVARRARVPAADGDRLGLPRVQRREDPARRLVPARVRRLPVPGLHDVEARPLDRQPRTRRRPASRCSRS